MSKVKIMAFFMILVFVFFTCSICIAICSPCNSADIDNDGDVDGTDLVMFIRAYKAYFQDSTELSADIDNNGKVNEADVEIFARYFGCIKAAIAPAPTQPILTLSFERGKQKREYLISLFLPEFLPYHHRLDRQIFLSISYNRYNLKFVYLLVISI